MTRRINMERWQPHVEEARRRGVSLKAYAAQEGVSLYSLYRASQVLGQSGAARPTKTAGGKFAAVCCLPLSFAFHRPGYVASGHRRNRVSGAAMRGRRGCSGTPDLP